MEPQFRVQEKTFGFQKTPASRTPFSERAGGGNLAGEQRDRSGIALSPASDGASPSQGFAPRQTDRPEWDLGVAKGIVP
jgi:hypothetical protein